MSVRSTSVRRIALNALETVVFIPFTVVLYSLDLIGRSPWWLLFMLMFGGGLLQQPGVQRWLAGGDLTRRVPVRIALHMGLVAAISYTSGWGPLLGIGFVLVTTMHISMSGAGVWRHAVVWSLVGVAAGQSAIALGWVHCYFLPSPYMHVIGGGGALIAAFAIRTVGLAAEHRERAETTARRSEERFRALVQDSHDVITVSDRDGRVTYVSPAVRRVTGFAPDEMTGTEYATWLHPDDFAGAQGQLAAALADPGGQHTAELRIRRPEGGWRWLEVTVRNLLDNPAVEGLVANYRDITERRAVQERLAYDASHDALTGLANRAAFLQRLGPAVAGQGGTAVLFLDLDRFKQVNDTLGHEAGDALIVAAGAMMRRCVLGSDLVGRLGGDEFGILLTGIESAQHAIRVAKRILAEMDQPIRLAGRDVHVRASIGVAVSSAGGGDQPRSSGDDLLHQADIAMYAAKRRQTHSFQLYVDGLADPAEDAVPLEEELQRAVRDGQLRLQYQPIVSLDSGDVTGVEALVRWAHPTRGLLGPQEFIPLAEETGVIGELGEWVLEQACRQVSQWQQRMPPSRRFGLSVNLSPRQLAQAELVDRVTAILDRTGFDPADLVLEITESALVDDVAAIPQLTALSECGIRIALDDFGSGLSSLRYLARIPVNILKIDRCYVAELNGSPTASAVAEAVVRLAQILHLDTVAEGIEDEAQATELTLLGCRTGQGYHYARPMDPEDIGALLDSTDPGRRTLPARTPEQLPLPA
jgi:diguanylate cyclase (GGDEF)-like protein/PAS domain S-box-containing protein